MQILRANNTAQIEQVLRLLLRRPGQSQWELQQSVKTLRTYASTHHLSLEHGVLAMEGKTIRSACLLIDSPGHTSSVFLPPADTWNGTVSAQVQPGEGNRDLMVSLLRESVVWAHQRHVYFIQGMIEAGAQPESDVFRAAGFEYLTCLLYMESDLSQSIPACRETPALQWLTYDAATHAEFIRVLAGTYQQSLDCPALTGRRQIEDIVASHRGTGQFDPQLWLLARQGNESLGLILLAPIPERGSMEIVYMGLLPAARGRGAAAAMIRRAVELARERAILRLTVTVDHLNTPAIKVYQRFGFIEQTRRDAWVYKG